MRTFLRAAWWPFGLLGRVLAWVMLPPLGLLLSWRRGRDRRHRQLVASLRDQRPR